MSNSDESIRKRAWVDKDDCPMAQAAEVLGDRWTLLILREAFYGVRRFDDILQDLSIPRSVLTQRLKRMMADELMECFEYQEQGARKRFGYRLTPRGRALAPFMVAMKEWGEAYVLDASSPVDIQNVHSGEWLSLKPVDQEGRVADWRDVRMKQRKG